MSPHTDILPVETAKVRTFARLSAAQRFPNLPRTRRIDMHEGPGIRLALLPKV